MGKKKVNLSLKGQLTAMMIFIGIFLLIGLSLIYFNCIHYMFKNYSTKNRWEKVPCRIVTVNLGRTQRQRGRTKRVKLTSYGVTGKYTYEYKGKKYTSTNLNFQQDIAFGYKDLVSKRLKEYRELKKPSCYVNPEKPEEAVLDVTLMPTAKLASWIGLGFIAMSLLMIRQGHDWYRKAIKVQPTSKE